MVKILLAVDAVSPDQQALEFTCYLSRLTQTKMTDVFLENTLYEIKPVLNDLQGRAVIYRDTEDLVEYFARKAKVEKNISTFKELCKDRDIGFRIHRDHGHPADELIEESKFADVLIIDSGISLKNRQESNPTGFVRDILRNAACPVIIAPESFEGLDEVVFAYDGSPSSVFAIKQFTYLFPQLKDKKISILKVHVDGTWQNLEKNKINEWLVEHYSDVHFEVLEGNTEDRLFDFLFKRRNMFLVMGAYGRNAFSNLLKSSHADPLIRIITQPIFIAHR